MTFSNLSSFCSSDSKTFISDCLIPSLACITDIFLTSATPAHTFCAEGLGLGLVQADVAGVGLVSPLATPSAVAREFAAAATPGAVLLGSEDTLSTGIPNLSRPYLRQESSHGTRPLGMKPLPPPKN